MAAVRPVSDIIHRHGRLARLIVELLRQGLWYVAAGAGSTAAHALLFLLMREPLGTFAANGLALTITTIANTEFHHRITFEARGSSLFRRTVAVSVTIGFYAVYTSAALYILQSVIPDPTAQQQTATIVAASVLLGVVRFTLLRVWVFARGRAIAAPR